MIRRLWRFLVGDRLADLRAERDRVREEAQRDLRDVQVRALTEELAAVRQQLVQMTASRDALLWSEWMRQATRQRASASEDRHREARRQQALADAPTATYATQKIERQQE